ncbi:MAG: hypothetical protein HY852_21330 [Bradyrhizobium sp.]|uniref:hypothetical protein n=1 Tax=Bradyrhizobium sp. TaxID=376 RepID=UPI0025BEEB6C|nr:hypothetical protein [Bradyrhizobium sp.]MBI5264349.1 hypothetical protein [Bradyrhizobium sp.]
MRIALTTLAALLLLTGAAQAQNQNGGPSGRGAVTGDPAASSANPRAEPTTGTAMKPGPSGSGTSTSGGRDDNLDQGRDKMPESNRTVRPQSEQRPER